MAEKNLQMRRKLADGNFDDYFPITKAVNVKMDDGSTLESSILFRRTDKGLPYDNKVLGNWSNTHWPFTSPLKDGILYASETGNNVVKSNDVTNRESGSLSPFKSPFGGQHAFYNSEDGYVYFINPSSVLHKVLFSALNPSTTPTTTSGTIYLNGGRTYPLIIGGQIYIVWYGVNADWSTKLYRATWGTVTPTLIATIYPGQPQAPTFVSTDGTYIYILISSPNGGYRITKYNTSGVLLTTHYIDTTFLKWIVGFIYSGTPGLFYLIYQAHDMYFSAKINI
ncbi:hypothetical protein [Desulfosporosinus sp.]|uniref:hypothetical protein n=1 Tax=Desulfosporosinus sp. TaxID=157907 RepID=UPI0025C2C7ED|nr:hypothetical protein [Desulfosporosinus sp.]MBC2722042.1 hypothetical protein [Desulfosporosinus sp.]MBC2728025.1 hypothetical protein [Desulfosporosinus sp.]